MTGNASLLAVQWTFDKSFSHEPYQILMQITANFPVRLWRGFVNTIIIFVVQFALKHGNFNFKISDVSTAFKNIVSLKFICSALIMDLTLSSPFAISHALLRFNLTWSVIYCIFGLILNYLFSLGQILLIEDPTVSLTSCFIWSIDISFSQRYFTPILFSNLFVFIMNPILVSVPFCLVLQIITFYEAFGFASDEEMNVIFGPFNNQ